MLSNKILSKLLTKNQNPNLKSSFPRLVLQRNKNPRFFQTSRYLVNQLGVGVIASQLIRFSKVNELLKLWAKETPLTHFVDTGSGWLEWAVQQWSVFVLVVFGLDTSMIGGGVFVEVIFKGILPSFMGLSYDIINRHCKQPVINMKGMMWVIESYKGAV